MSLTRNPPRADRARELWNPIRLAVMEREIRALAPVGVVLSGGWAWHFMSPVGHTEFRQGHDYKDVDLFLPKRGAAIALEAVKERGYSRAWTKYDRFDSQDEFRRYVR